MHPLRRRYAALACLLLAGLAAGPAMAQQPRPWEVGMQPAFSPIKQEIIWLHDLVLWIITIITVFVAALLVWVLYRYDHRRNAVPSRISHHTWLEVAWTLIPALVLVIIAIPSFRLVYYEDRTHEPDLTVKVTGHQWYWEYTYPDQNGLHFESYILPQDKLQPGQLRLLDVDNQLVLPAGKRIRILATSADVIHSFFIPSLGVQRYAMPGRTIETWVEISKPGTYYGECNQVCGTNHSQMPISVQAVTPEEFTAWLAQAKTKFSQADTPAGQPGRIDLAAAQH